MGGGRQVRALDCLLAHSKMLKDALENDDSNIWKLLAGSRMMILGYVLCELLSGGRLDCARHNSSPTQYIKGLRSFILRGTSENPLLHHWWRARECVRSHSVFANHGIVGGDADSDDANRVDGGAS